MPTKSAVLNMVIAFSNDEIKKLCNTASLLDKAYSPRDAVIIKRRLMQLAAANDLGEFSPEGSPPLKCERLNNEHSRFKVPVSKNLHLLFSSPSEVAFAKPWSTINTIQIESITEIENDFSSN